MKSVKLVILSQFTSPNMIRTATALIISFKMHFLQISDFFFFFRVGITSFVDFMQHVHAGKKTYEKIRKRNPGDS